MANNDFKWRENEKDGSRSSPYPVKGSDGKIIAGVVHQSKFDRKADKNNDGYPHTTHLSEGKDHYSTGDGRRYELGSNGKPDFSKEIDRNGNPKKR